jgi:ketosteroid isomerase-like protein
MTTSKFPLVAAMGAALSSLTLACTTHRPDADVQRLVDLSKESNAALLRGDVGTYAALVKHADDFTLMSPFGGKPTRGTLTGERMQSIGKFFKNGSIEQELVQAYASPDLVVLATIERAHVEAGGLPAQDWGLRVTLVYRREGSGWRLVHRHADPLADAIGLNQAAALARGERAPGG